MKIEREIEKQIQVLTTIQQVTLHIRYLAETLVVARQ